MNKILLVGAPDRYLKAEPMSYGIRSLSLTYNIDTAAEFHPEKAAEIKKKLLKHNEGLTVNIV